MSDFDPEMGQTPKGSGYNPTSSLPSDAPRSFRGKPLSTSIKVVANAARAALGLRDAANGEDALAWCGRRVVDVLITDVELPGSVDGWQIAERCREHDPELPVIYATGFSPVAPRPVPGSLTLQKPYHPEDIVRAVRRVASNQA